MSLKYDISGAQIDGARDYQEDSFLSSHIKEGDGDGSVILCIVADGMGGHAAGHVASNLAVQAFNKHVTANYQTYDIPALLLNAIDEANNAIENTIKETDALKGMGCTLIAALCSQGKLYWISVGDSHLYLIQNNVIKKMNDDHSYGGYLDRMAEEGSEVKEHNGYSRHMLLSALTGDPIPAVDCPDIPVPISGDDRLILCSDGLDTLDLETVLTTSNKAKNVKQLTENLLVEVTNAQLPRQDNTTILVIDVIDTSKSKREETVEIVKPRTIPPVIKSNTVTATNPTHYPSYAKKNDKGFPWISIVGLLTLIALGVWWSGSKNLLPDISIFSSPPTSENIEQEETQAVTQIATPPTISYFTDPLKNGRQGPEMSLIQSGTFSMGGTGSAPPSNERPRHSVAISKFAISSKEITRGEFALYTGKSINAKTKKLPISNISWHTAKKYVKWLSFQTSQTYRLPTEAEWEYAARAGTTSPFWWGYTPGKNNALCVGCGDPFEPTGTTVAGSFSANPFGLFDTAGNVSEWVEDCYHDSYEGAPENGDAVTSEPCNERIVRGGSFVNAAKSLYSSRREKLNPGKSDTHIGFRVAREM